MSRVPITVMGFRCERCSHEWIPRGSGDEEPRVCPKCRSPWWNKPRKAMMPYDEFRDRVVKALREAERPISWTEVRTAAGLRQAFPNNQWVHRLETDAGLHRQRDSGGVIHWSLTKRQDLDLFQPEAAQTPKQDKPSSRRK
jgi:hypothetical protein